MVLNLESLVFSSKFLRVPVWMNSGRLKCGLGCMEKGAAVATPSLWVVVAVSRRRTRRLFMPLHVGNGTLDLRIRAMAPRQALLWRGLLRFHDGCSEVAGSPIKLL